MRIGYIHLSYGEWTNKGNYNAQEIGLAKAYEELGHQTYIVFWVSPKDNRCYKEVKVTSKISKVYLPYKYRLAHHVIVNLDLIRPYKLDLIHLQADNLLYLPNAVNYCIKNRIPYYCYVGTIKSSNPNCFKRKIIDIISRRNINAFKKSLVFAKTPKMVKTLQNNGISSVFYAPVGLDISVIPKIESDKEKIKRDLKIPQNKVIILCVCALRHDKHPFDIFKLSEKLNNEYQILFIGSKGPLEKDFINKINQREEYNIINFLGQIHNNDIHSYYKVADYVVNFNPNEIFGMAILEAMYHECTVIAMNAPGPSCIIENKKSGFVVNSIDEMANIIKSKITINSSRQRILDMFTWKKTAQLFLSHFPNLK